MKGSRFNQETSSGSAPMQLSEWVVRDLISNDFVKHIEMIGTEEAEEELFRLRGWYVRILPLYRKVEELSARINNTVPEILEAKIKCYELMDMIDTCVRSLVMMRKFPNGLFVTVTGLRFMENPESFASNIFTVPVSELLAGIRTLPKTTLPQGYKLNPKENPLEISRTQE